VEMLTGKMPYKEDFSHNMQIIYKVGGGIINPLTSKAMMEHPASTESDVKDFMSNCFKM
jgi:hypothetical protein